MGGLLEKVIEIAETAGNLMITEKNVDVKTKGTKENYVTSTDLKIQKYLRAELLSALPGSGFLGEEEDAPDGGAVYGPDDWVWVVDPIDGTANYARGIPMSVVAIGLVKNGESVLGVVRQPYTGETFWAEKGKGAFLDGKPLRVSARDKEHAMVCTAWSCYDKKRSPLCFDVTEKLYPVCEDIRRIGTAAYELCLVAKGSCDIYFEVRLAPWDYTASACIVSEAGGCLASERGKLDHYRPCAVMGANNGKNLDFLRRIVKDAAEKHPESEIDFKA